MGIKLLIAVAILIATSEGPAHADVGDVVEVDSKDEALSLCRMGRAYFVEKAADPTKGLLTAGKEEADAVKKHAAAIAAERKSRAAEAAGVSPAVQAMIDAAVSKALAAAKPVTA